MTSAFTQPTGPTAYPLQPTADGPQVPRGLDVDGPGHTPIPQNAHGYAPNTQHDSLNPSAAGGNYTSVSNPNSGLNEPREGFTERREGYKPQEGFGERREGYDQPREGFGERHQGLNEPREHIGQQHYKNPLASHAPVTGTGTGTVGTGENFIGIPTTTFDVKAQDPKTIIVSGGGVSYTMATTYENKREVVTIRRTGGNQSHSTTGAGYGPQSTTTGPNLGQHTTAGTHYGTQVPPSGAHLGDHTAIEAHHTSQPTTAGANYGSQVPTGGAYVGDHTAVGAHHDPQSTATGTNYGANLPPSQAGLGSTEPALMTEMHDDQEPVVAQVEPHQLRSTKISFKGGPQIKLKDWLSGRGTPIHTFAEGDQRFEWRKSFKGMHHQLELFTLDQPDNRIAWAEKISTTEETLKEHEAGRPPLPAHPGTARLTLTEQALPLMDTVVVSFLLVDRESRNDPLHA